MVELTDADRAAMQQPPIGFVITDADVKRFTEIAAHGGSDAKLIIGGLRLLAYRAGIESGIERAARLFDTHPIDADRAAKVRALKASA